MCDTGSDLWSRKNYGRVNGPIIDIYCDILGFYLPLQVEVHHKGVLIV